MCGIAGILRFARDAAGKKADDEKVLQLLRHRGPDARSVKREGRLTLYHTRLKIVDVSEASDQPFSDVSSGQTLIFNGEIFNYRELSHSFENLKTSGDTEVLYKLLQRDGKSCINELNGFFAFAFYDTQREALLLARDRFGVKPIYYYSDENIFAFASELAPLMELIGPRPLNTEQMYSYFRLNYCAGTESIFEGVKKLEPGSCLEIVNSKITKSTWYNAAKRQPGENLFGLLEDAVKLRLHADVPLGTFLSGGMDSSIISALAKKHKPDLHTFSIGFQDEKFFDESAYAELVAKHINSTHHLVRLKEDDFLSEFDNFLSSIDEPFADSSAFNYFMLSQHARKHVKVALGGDGADELFKGYQKHRALLLDRDKSRRALATISGALVPDGAGSRQGWLGNKTRQLKKFAELNKLPKTDKLKFLASIAGHEDCSRLLRSEIKDLYFNRLFKSSGSYSEFPLEDTFDIQTVLADDMLVKADRFSMRHGLEIRNPFLDYRVVEYALNLPPEKKIGRKGQKLILKETFRDLLPAEIFSRKKQGFELPIQAWLTGKLSARLESAWFNKEKINAEKIFNYDEIELIRKQLFSGNPGDSGARAWAVIVFTAWMDQHQKYISLPQAK